MKSVVWWSIGLLFGTGDPHSKVLCGSEEMRPGQTCDRTQYGLTATETYEEKRQEAIDSANSFNGGGRWVTFGIGAGIAALCGWRLAIAIRRRASGARPVTPGRARTAGGLRPAARIRPGCRARARTADRLRSAAGIRPGCRARARTADQLRPAAGIRAAGIPAAGVPVRQDFPQQPEFAPAQGTQEQPGFAPEQRAQEQPGFAPPHGVPQQAALQQPGFAPAQGAHPQSGFAPAGIPATGGVPAARIRPSAGA